VFVQANPFVKVVFTIAINENFASQKWGEKLNENIQLSDNKQL